MNKANTPVPITYVKTQNFVSSEAGLIHPLGLVGKEPRAHNTFSSHKNILISLKMFWFILETYEDVFFFKKSFDVQH